MPRTARIAPKEHIYHVLTRGNNRQDVFEDDEDLRKYLDLLFLYKEKYHFKLYHYVIWTYGSFLAGQIDRYKSIIISKDEYLLACGSYVELNPVRAKMVEDPMDYRWSSYLAYGYGKRDVLVDEHPVYLQLSEEKGERRKKYREFVRGMLKEKEAMKGEMDRRLVYGGDDFVKAMEATYNISDKIKRMGRQRGWRKNKENRPV